MVKTKNLIIITWLLLFTVGLAYSQSITVTAPGSGAVLCRNQRFTITWTSSGAMDPNVKIRLYQNPGAAAVRILNIIGSTDNDGSYTWSVPATLDTGDNFFIRVRTVDDAVMDDGDPFSIAVCSGSINVTDPTATAVFRARSNLRCAWNSSGISGNVRIELEKHGTAELFPISASHPYNGSPFDYTVADAVPEGSYRVKISQDAVVGYSGWIGILAWVPPGLSLVAPNGGETLTQGSFFDITWNAQNLDGKNLRIELLRGGVLHTVLCESLTVNAGRFTWRNILSSRDLVKHMTGDNFKIRIRTLDRLFQDVSEANFAIKAPPGIWIFKPAAPDIWDEDSTQEIRWNAQGLEGRLATIILKFTSGSPLNIRRIAEHVPVMDKRYSWKVMDLVDGPYNLHRGTYSDAVIIVTTEDPGVRCASSSKEFTIRKR